MRHRVLGFISTSLIVVLLIANVACRNSNHPPSPATTASSIEASLKDLATDEEKTYVDDASRHMIVQCDQASKIIDRMEDVGKGDASLKQLYAALSDARDQINKSWENDFHKAWPGEVPHIFASVDSKIRQSHINEDLALNEILRYWQDHRSSHLSRGIEMLNAAFAFSNNTMEELNTALDQVKLRKK